MVGVGERELMLLKGKAVAFLASADLAAAERFYVGLLGLQLKHRDDFGLVVEANDVTIRIARVDGFEAQTFTVLGFDVADVERTVRALTAQGIEFEIYPGMKQDSLGIWIAPGGSRIAWFKDSDGNTLSVAQHPN